MPDQTDMTAPRASSLPEIRPTEDGTQTVYSAAYHQTYHSIHGARTESVHVFLEASGAAGALREGQPLRVLEVGFGTGLNFLLTADLALQHGASLQYVALERELITSETFRALGYETLIDAPILVNKLYRWVFTLPGPDLVGLLTCRLHDTLHLDLLLGDAVETPLPPPAFDVIYQDAFSPEANPELWTPAFFAKLFAALKPGGRLSTYSASRRVHNALADAGFSVEKYPGPPGKREIIVATRPRS